MNPRKLLAQLRRVYSQFTKMAKQPIEDRNKLLVSAVAIMDAVVRLAIVQYKSQLPQNAAKLFDIAGKCRARAMSTTFNEEKDLSLRIALLKMEQMIPMLSPPAFQLYIDKFNLRASAHKEGKSAKGPKAPRAPRTPASAQPQNQYGVRRKFSPVPQIVPVGSPLIINILFANLKTPFRASSAKAKAFRFWFEDFRTKEEVAQYLNQVTNGKGKSLVWLLWNKRNGGDESMHWSFIQKGNKSKLVVCDPTKLPKP